MHGARSTSQTMPQRSRSHRCACMCGRPRRFITMLPRLRMGFWADQVGGKGPEEERGGRASGPAP